MKDEEYLKEEHKRLIEQNRLISILTNEIEKLNKISKYDSLRDWLQFAVIIAGIAIFLAFIAN